MSIALVDFLVGALLLGAGIGALVFTHRFVAKAPLSTDDYLVPAMAGTLITGLIACGIAFLVESALIVHMLREATIGAAIGLSLFIVARLVLRRRRNRVHRIPPAQALGV